METQVDPILENIIKELIDSIDGRSLPLSEDIFIMEFFLNPVYYKIATSSHFNTQAISDKIVSYAIQLKFCMEDCTSLVKEIEH